MPQSTTIITPDPAEVAAAVWAYANRTLTESQAGGNATVPLNVPIQPPQAFVDCFASPAAVFNAILSGEPIDWSNKGIVSVDTTSGGLLGLLDGTFAATGNQTRFNLSGNAITNTDAMLANLVPNGNYNGTLDLSGGTNAAPTGGNANADLVTLRDRNWIVETN